jgi:hypothetical protein
VSFRAADGFFDELRRGDLTSGNQLGQSQTVEVFVFSKGQSSTLLGGAGERAIGIPSRRASYVVQP